MRKIYLLAGLLVLSICSFAQKNGSIKGIAFDTISKEPVASATITLVQKKDSALVSFTLTDNKGYFELKGIGNGEYRLLITHVNYHNSNKVFTIDDNNKNIDLGNVVMNDKTKVLDEVVVKNEAPPVTLINDTIQYNAGSFKTAPNSSVEQLLKKLPGVQVDKDGNIKAQGEKVQKVLVDGKEFFGSDPKIATKNLPADAIDKVQVYDKQSDQAQLTGFEDGNYEKTINLKLKEDKKKGAFGKLMAGGGTDGRYEAKGNVNSFKGARQMSVIGMGNNDNGDGFTFMDILSFTGALSQLKNGGGNININTSDASSLGLTGGGNTAIKTVWGGGINYNNIIGKKLDLQSNYFYNHYDPNTKSFIQRQYPNGSLYNQNSLSDNQNDGHRLNLNLLYQIDSSASLRITPSFSYQTTDNKGQNDYYTSSGNTLVNDGSSDATSNTTGYNFGNNIIFRKKLNKRGRTFSLSLQTSLNNSNGKGVNSSLTGFYNTDGSLNHKDTIDQHYRTDGDLRGYNAKAVYTEPLFRKSLMEFSVGRSNTKNTADKTTMDYNKLNGKYDQLNQSLSNDYDNTYGYTTAGIRIRTQKKKFNYMFGATWQKAELEGKITTGIKDSLIGKTFYNILPNARFQYNFTKFKSLAVNYSTSTNQPSMSQLQPVPDVSDPLNIKQGNADLKQEFTHTIQGNMNMVSPYKNKNIFLFFVLQHTQNKIVNYDSLDQFGVRYTRPVNVNGVNNLSGNINWGMPVRFLKGNFSIGSNVSYYMGKQYVNTSGVRSGGGSTGASILSGANTFSYGPNMRLDMNPGDKLSIALTANMNYNNSKYSKAATLNTNYLSQEYETDIDWQLPKLFFFSTDFTYTINNQLADGFNKNVPIWNASISKQMLRFNRGELKFRVSDLLNRNTGISRSVNMGYIQDSQTTVLQRFFMLSFTYSLSKTGLGNTVKDGGMRVIMK